MKKNLFILAILAVFSTVFITSCGDEEDQYACSIAEYVGSYSGSHSLKITEPIALDVPIADNVTIAAVAGTDSVDVTSTKLNSTFRGVIEDCKIVVEDAYIASFSTTISGSISAAVTEVTANLTVSKNVTKGIVYTTIYVQEGSAAISGTSGTIDISDTELNGTFN